MGAIRRRCCICMPLPPSWPSPASGGRNFKYVPFGVDSYLALAMRRTTFMRCTASPASCVAVSAAYRMTPAQSLRRARPSAPACSLLSGAPSPSAPGACRSAGVATRHRSPVAPPASSARSGTAGLARRPGAPRRTDRGRTASASRRAPTWNSTTRPVSTGW